MNSAAVTPPPEMQYILEAAIAVFVGVVVFVGSFVTLRERHKDGEGWHVHAGALIYGLIFGVIIGFVIVPLRLFLVSGQVPPQTAGWFSLAFLVVMIALRRGLIGRLPFLGPQVRAFRRASLRRVIETSQEQLDKLTKKPRAGEAAL
jgi:hypothetical protein